jgi:hypothetical protein
MAARSALVLLLVVGVLSAWSAEPAVAPADRDRVDRAVEKALLYLQRNQRPDGSWRVNASQYGNEKSAPVTALCVMAFLSAGHTPTEGEYSRNVTAGIRFVLGCQRNNGVIVTGGGVDMYHHGICTLMLAEVVGMCPRDMADDVRAALTKAVDVIIRSQRREGTNHAGGWRYAPDGWDSDLSVTGWQLMALRAAKNVGCDVPASAIDRAVAYVRRCYDENRGSFGYQARGYRLSTPCAGTGILALELCGKDLHRCRESLRAGAYILQHGPRLGGEQHAFYGYYYCAQAMFQLGDVYWITYRARLHDLLTRSQAADGSWSMEDFEVRSIGPNYTTAMAVLALTVEYRLLPIYQRGEEPTEPDKDK